MQQQPYIIAIREAFLLKKENEEKAKEEAPVKLYFFGSRGKRSCIPIKLFEIEGFLDWIGDYKKEIFDKILSINDIQNLLDEFNNIP